MDDVVKYYKKYYDSNGYTMQGNKDTSRVKFLVSWVREFVPKGGKILDVGCGDMYLSTVLPEHAWVGLDINTSKALGNAIEHDIMSVPYPFSNASFDAVVCSEVLEHVWDPLVINAEVSRVLKPGGKYILSTPNYDHIDFFLSHYRPLLFDPNKPHLYEHIRQYNLEVHARMLEATGFRVLQHVGADAHYSRFFVEAKKELNKELEGKGYTESDVDVLLGKCFKEFSHTIMVVAQKL